MSNFGKLVRDKRERKGWTIRRAAEEVGLSIAQALEIDLGEMNVCKPEIEYV